MKGKTYFEYVCGLDINECDGNPCDTNATCNDTSGSYQCVCNSGFTGNGYNCSGDFILSDANDLFCFLLVFLVCFYPMQWAEDF